MRAILKHFNTLGDLNEYTKNPSDQALFSSSTKGATNVFVREILERDFGTRYSVLLELVYFDPIRMTALDPMHNLFLGTAKHKIYVRKTQKLLCDEDFKLIQDKMEPFQCSSDIGRLPKKCSSINNLL
jgi:hypothetical protein